MIDITVEINNAVPKGRPRTVIIKGNPVIFTPKRTREAMKEVALELKKVYRGEPGKGRFFVEMFFFHRSGKTDGDNLEKLLLDAAEGIVFENDSQVESVVRHKFSGHTKDPRTRARFVEMAEGDFVNTTWEIGKRT